MNIPEPADTWNEEAGRRHGITETVRTNEIEPGGIFIKPVTTVACHKQFYEPVEVQRIVCRGYVIEKDEAILRADILQNYAEFKAIVKTFPAKIQD